MGLDTSHNCWHGAYSAFMRWRQEIAKAAGIPLMLMEGFYDITERYSGVKQAMDRTAPRAYAFKAGNSGGFVADRDSLTAALADAAERGDAGRLHDFLAPLMPCFPLKWEILKDDPLNILLHHSDCDGEIAWEDCGPIADRLEELLVVLCEVGEVGGHIGHMGTKTKTFIEGLRLAASRKENVDFH